MEKDLKKGNNMYETKGLKEIISQFNTSEKTGLTTSEAAKRLATNGKNALIGKKKKSLFMLFLAQFNDPMIYILIICGVISFVLDEIADGFIILAVILVNAIIGVIQENKAEQALEALKKMSSPTTVVKREGKLIEIKAEDVVVGDVVILEEGRIVCADIRLSEAINMKADESSLTGESVPVEKNAQLVFSDEVALGDRANMVYMSTPIVYGRGEGIVIATGMQTEIGKIAAMLSNEKEELTPLQKRLADLSKLLGILTVVIVVALFIVALIQNRDPLEMFITSISLAVAAVPEGLAAVVTIVLSLGVQRMVKVNTIVKHLPSVETLGSVSVVCSDKTGTLTQNKMTVVKAFVNEKFYDITSENKDVLVELARGLSLCSNASIDNGVYGDPTEVALVDFANKFGMHKAELESEYVRIDEMPFDSVRKMMSTMHQKDNSIIIYTKGAMDSILKHTTRIKIDGVVRDITKKDIEKIQSASKEMAKSALRVLALAEHDSKEIDEENLIFIGLEGMVDPARPEAKPAVAKFNQAGIVTIMITGDHRDTAFAIAKELGIAQSEDQCISGDEVDEMSQEKLAEVVKNARVFARVSPEIKTRIVKALKSNNNIVAMTGDGVNDAPSLKASDIGIAMGITGTDVAKGAADMVLSDDNFASIELAVEEGRNIYVNIKKTILFLLSSNFGEVITMFLGIVIGLPVPLLAIHILWVNLITDSLPAIALGADVKDPDIMKDKPRPANESLFANHALLTTVFYGFVIATCSLFAFFIPSITSLGSIWSLAGAINAYNDPNLLISARTYAFTVLGMSQLFHMIGVSNMKKSFLHVFRDKNKLMLIAFVLGVVLQVAVTEVSFLSAMFKTEQLSASEWINLGLLSMLPLVIHEVIVFVQYIRRKINTKR